MQEINNDEDNNIGISLALASIETTVFALHKYSDQHS